MWAFGAGAGEIASGAIPFYKAAEHIHESPHPRMSLTMVTGDSVEGNRYMWH